jgi:gamma-glutamyltranspeptidase/glutathione hydrolase
MGVDPAEAVSAPRWLANGSGRTPGSMFAVAERDVPPVAKEAITEAGFSIEEIGSRDEWVGHAHVLKRGPLGFEVGCDPRSDGSALAG